MGSVSFFLRGLIIGFSIAAPVGPIGVLCIRRTIAQGRASGFISGLGAATADAIYGCIAGFGLTFISSLLISQQDWFRLVGGTFLCYLGI
ncbi:MAG: LysE family transporter, partial [Desulfobacterales bacterium]|nr:LysE family transporter [Desulfobacterales bacterium]